MCQPPQRAHLYQPSLAPLLADATMQAWMAFSSVSYRFFAAHDLPKKRSSSYGECLREIVSHHRSSAFCLAARSRSLRCFFWRFLVIGLLLDMGFPLMALLGLLDQPIVFAGRTSTNARLVAPYHQASPNAATRWHSRSGTVASRRRPTCACTGRGAWCWSCAG